MTVAGIAGGASCCDTAAPGTVPQTERMDYWDLGDINKR